MRDDHKVRQGWIYYIHPWGGWVVGVLFLKGFGRSYLCPLQVHGIHEGALKVLDPRVLPFQQTLKLKIRLCSASQVGQEEEQNQIDWLAAKRRRRRIG